MNRHPVQGATGQARYEACLQAHGFRVHATFSDQGGNHHFDAVRAC